MNGKIHIRPARPEDATSLLRITEQSIRGLTGGAYRQDQIDNWMKGRSADAYQARIEAGSIHVAEQNGEPVGYIDVIPGEINSLFILPEFAGKGVGRKLMEIGLPLVRNGHDGPVIVEATLNAEPFYAKFGFVTVGHGYFSHGVSETPPIEIAKMEHS